MRPITLAVIVFCLGVVLHAEPFVTDRNVDSAAEILEKQIPAFAVDQLFEAKRGDAMWHYAFWTRIEKAWVEEVHVTVRQKTAYSSDVVVEVVRIDGGLVKPKSAPQQLAASEWTEKIRDVLKK